MQTGNRQEMNCPRDKELVDSVAPNLLATPEQHGCGQAGIAVSHVPPKKLIASLAELIDLGTKQIAPGTAEDCHACGVTGMEMT